jgi:hypothetical protein
VSVEQSIAESERMCAANEGPELAMFVCGSAADAAFWEARSRLTARDVFRADGATRIRGIAEKQRLGSLFGTLNAWRALRAEPLPSLTLMSMVFGEGRRLSPFTQALGNRKAAFTTPRLGARSGRFLNAAEVGNLYTNAWLQHLRRRGFGGVLVKWGDEAILPGIGLAETAGATGGATASPAASSLAEVDVVRFVWRVEPTEVLAAQKDWFLIDRQSELVTRVLPRQPLADLLELLSRAPAAAAAVNLGSLALTHGFLDAALAVFGREVDRAAALDWDPHFWVALLADSAASFLAYCDTQAAAGRPFAPPAGLPAAEVYGKAQEIRALVRGARGRDVRIGTLDFGAALWLDFGLQSTLGEMLASLPLRTPRSALLRRAFAIPEHRDERGNILVESSVPVGATIEDSVLLRSALADAASAAHGAVLINSAVGRAAIAAGGAVIDSRIVRLEMPGGNAIAFHVTADRLDLGAGGRAASVELDGAPRLFTATEKECGDPAAFDVALGRNPMSFAALSRAVAARDASAPAPAPAAERKDRP